MRRCKEHRGAGGAEIRRRVAACSATQEHKSRVAALHSTTAENKWGVTL